MMAKLLLELFTEYYSGIWNNDVGRFWFDEETKQIATLMITKYRNPWLVNERFSLVSIKAQRILLFIGEDTVPWMIQDTI